MGSDSQLDDAPSPGAEVVLAGKAQRPLIEALFQFYFYDFSEMEPAGSGDYGE